MLTKNTKKEDLKKFQDEWVAVHSKYERQA